MAEGEVAMKTRREESGFSYIDVMIAVVILMVGIMGLVGAITRAVRFATENQELLTAKQFASSTIESIFSARDVANEDNSLPWDSIGNVGDGAIPGAVFLTGKQTIYQSAGKDGIVGTADDKAGADGVEGNSDDAATVIGYQREITITDVADPARPSAPISLRQITVTIHYFIGASPKEEVFTTYIANYRTNVELD